MFDVAGHDYLSTTLDGRRKDVPVAEVGKLQLRDRLLKAGHHHVSDRLVHAVAQDAQLGFVDVRPVLCQIPQRLAQDRFGPLSLDESALAEPDEQVAQRVGISTFAS